MEYASLGMDYQKQELFDVTIKEDDLFLKLDESGELLTSKSGGQNLLSSRQSMGMRDTNIFWSYIVHSRDPHKFEIIDIVSKLGKFHGMDSPYDPLEFDMDNDSQWINWINQKIKNGGRHPRKKLNHVLIVATPEQIPFKFQSLLSVLPKVGRVCFDNLDDLQNYVNKVITMSTTPPDNLKKQSSFFATNYGTLSNGNYDVTHYSYHELVEPLKQFLSNEGIPVEITKLEEMKKIPMVKKLETNHSSLVFFAGHGVGNVPPDKQSQLQGAFCCQDWIETKNDSELFSANDFLNTDDPFLEGSMIVNFSCFSYGTPKLDDIVNFSFEGSQTGDSLASESFIAAIPKKLLAHPKGPLGYIGHANSLYLSGFYNSSPSLSDDQRRDVSSFEAIVDCLLQNDTLGNSIDNMIDNASVEKTRFIQAVQRYQMGDESRNTKLEIANSYFQSFDFTNYLIFGDPAIRLDL